MTFIVSSFFSLFSLFITPIRLWIHPSTESALIKVTNNIFILCPMLTFSALILFHLPAALDTVDFSLLYETEVLPSRTQHFTSFPLISLPALSQLPVLGFAHLPNLLGFLVLRTQCFFSSLLFLNAVSWVISPNFIFKYHLFAYSHIIFLPHVPRRHIFLF